MCRNPQEYLLSGLPPLSTRLLAFGHDEPTMISQAGFQIRAKEGRFAAQMQPTTSATS